jgi:hypothetical protein
MNSASTAHEGPIATNSHQQEFTPDYERKGDNLQQLSLPARRCNAPCHKPEDTAMQHKTLAARSHSKR